MGLVAPVACGVLVLQPGIELSSLALQGGFLTIGPPGKSRIISIFQVRELRHKEVRDLPKIPEQVSGRPGSKTKQLSSRVHTFPWAVLPPLHPGPGRTQDTAPTREFQVAVRAFILWGQMNLPRHQPYSLERNRQPSHHPGLTFSLVGTLVANVSFCLQGEFFGRNWNSLVPFDAPPITLPQKHDHMIYFAVSEYVFNRASRVYHQAGQMKFTIQNKHVSRGGKRLGVPREKIRWDSRSTVSALGSREKNVAFGVSQIGVRIQAVPQFPSLCV